jgi:HPt (histidine-containing phosphotransfer) domain-containing protein
LDDLLNKPYTLDACAALLQRWLGSSAAISATTTAIAAATATPSMAAAAPLSHVDPGTVAGLRGLASSGSGDLYSRLVDLFRSNSPADLIRLSGALTAGDLSAAAKICHKLKSSAANVGALAFANAVAELESVCVARKVQEARQLYEALAMVHPQLLLNLQGLQMRATA